MLESLDISTRIRRLLGGDQASDKNRGTRAATLEEEEDDSERTFRPGPKRARLGDSSSSLAQLTEA